MGWFSEDVEVVDKQELANNVQIANKNELRHRSTNYYLKGFIIENRHKNRQYRYNIDERNNQ